MKADESATQTFIHSTIYGIFLQIVCKFITFYINLKTVRIADPDVLGLVNVKLVLFQTTVLILSREPFRKALSSCEDYQQILYTIRWVPRLGFIFTFILGLVWMFILVPNTIFVYYHISVIIIGLSTVMDVLNEKYWYSLRLSGHIKTNILVDGISNVCRALFVVVFIMLDGLKKENAVLILSFGYLVQSMCCYLLNFWVCCSYYGFKYEPSNKEFSTMIVVKFFKQTVIKQLLTECERYIMTVTTFIPLFEQGIYDAIVNLTSLIPRLIYAPIEESLYVFLSKTLPRLNTTDGCQIIVVDHHDYNTNKNYYSSLNVFNNIQRLFSIIGLSLLLFGVALSNDLLTFYYGRNGSTITGKHILIMDLCFVYISIISLNGITEAFLFATMSTDQIENHNRKLVIFSTIYLLLCLVTTPWMHSYGFIFAQCVVMFLRIFSSIEHIKSYYNMINIPWNIYDSFVPHPILIISLFTGSLLLLLEIPITFRLICAFSHRQLLSSSTTQPFMYKFFDIFIVFICIILIFLKYENKLIKFIFSYFNYKCVFRKH